MTTFTAPLTLAQAAFTLVSSSTGKADVTPILATVQLVPGRVTSTDSYRVARFEHAAITADEEGAELLAPAEFAAWLKSLKRADLVKSHGGAPGKRRGLADAATDDYTLTITSTGRVDTRSMAWRAEITAPAGTVVAQFGFIAPEGNYPPVARLFPEQIARGAGDEILPISGGVGLALMGDILASVKRYYAALGETSKDFAPVVISGTSTDNSRRSAPMTIVPANDQHATFLLQPNLIK